MDVKDGRMKTRLKKHIRTLSSKAFQGRLAGTVGAEKTSEYLATELLKIGAQPSGEQGYFSEVLVPATHLNGAPQLKIGDWHFRHRIDFGEMGLSSGGTYEGELAVLHEQEEEAERFEGKIVLLPKRPVDFDLEKTVLAGIEEGIKGFLFEEGEPRWFHKSVATFRSSGIPVIRIRKAVAEMLSREKGKRVQIHLPLETGKRVCRNVLGFIPGKDRQRTLLLTAHYDHLGDDPKGHRYPGALDDASGVALLLEIGRIFSSGENVPAVNLLLGFLTGEESGHWGAKALLKEQKTPFFGVISLDVLGLTPELENLRIGEPDKTNPWVKYMRKRISAAGIHGKQMKGRDDATIFQGEGINAIGFGEYYLSNIGPRIHTPEDVESAIQYDGLIKMVRLLEETIKGMK